MKPIRQTTLPVYDLHALERALRSPVDPEDLVCVEPVRMQPATSYRSVHALMLANVLTADSWDSFDMACDIAERLLMMRAPITDEYGDGAISQFCSFGWPGDEVRRAHVAQLADKYVAAGLFELDGAVGGTPPTRAERDDSVGVHIQGIKPLTCAILLEDKVFVEYLLERNVCLDLGLVYSDQPPMSALELALEHGRGEIHALLAENSMQRQLASVKSTLSAEIDLCAAANPRLDQMRRRIQSRAL